MTAATSPIPGLDEIQRNGDPKRLADAARRITERFLQGAAKLRPDHVDLFDGILIDLVVHTDLAERLSRLGDAPRALVGQLAREHEILIAGPLLRRSPVIDEATLVEIAQIKGQGHLLAMSERPTLSPDLTDVIVRRGDRDVVRRAAGNAGALFSPTGYFRADQARKPGRRADADGRPARRSFETPAEGLSEKDRSTSFAAACWNPSSVAATSRRRSARFSRCIAPAS